MTNAPYNPAGGQTYNLGTSIGSTDSTILLSSFLEPVTNVPYTMNLLNTQIVYGTIGPKTTSSEFISFTGITQNADGTATLTGVVRGLAKKYPFTTNAAYKLPHSGQTQFILSDAPQVFQEYVSLNNDETIGGVKTFSSNVTVPLTPVASTDAASKGYADGLAIAGAPDASTTVKGIGKVSVAPVSPTNPIFVGDNDTRVPTVNTSALTAAQLLALPGNNTDVAVGSGNKYVTQTGLQHGAEFYGADSGAVNVMVVTLSPIPTSYTAGMVIKTKANHTNTTTTPTINVNGLGAVTIQKNGTSALVAGDILINQVITLMYDGTVFQLQNPPALTPPLATIYKSGIDTSRNMGTTSGTLAIPHGLGVIPKYIRITTVMAGGIRTSSVGTYNGSTQCAILVKAGSPDVTITSTSTILGLTSSAGDETQTAIATFDATNINLAFSKSGSTGGETINIMWEANS